MAGKDSFFKIEYDEIIYFINKDSICHMYESQGHFGTESHLVLKSGKRFTYGMPLEELMKELERAI
ncbi:MULTISPECIES: hypothetical protein [Providencia]|uniref:Uncharacterized protein n=1 Tax=Providencia vermicola TaxID=333965 RepID=A0AAX3RWT2_9GAMM|nr:MULTISPECIES: hypothetical protein [Providencia]HEM6870800.1 hypothetical protein [Providencia stuartii]MTB40768.1 hypothetical protein [Providencia sp. wls1949]MTC08576.1 hypothetical protein [Providencia sp. wls1948]USB37102.1 hypothetical protein M5J11_00855 [Providencia vermicola]WFC06034.1 hypothetical protein PG365_15200 [Providencia vermicola]